MPGQVVAVMWWGVALGNSPSSPGNGNWYHSLVPLVQRRYVYPTFIASEIVCRVSEWIRARSRFAHTHTHTHTHTQSRPSCDEHLLHRSVNVVDAEQFAIADPRESPKLRQVNKIGFDSGFGLRARSPFLRIFISKNLLATVFRIRYQHKGRQFRKF